MTWIKRHHGLSILAAVLAALVGLYALAGFFLAPYLIRTRAPEQIQAALGVPAALDEVSLNPFTFRLEAKGFRMGPDLKKPMFAFEQAVVDLDSASLFQWAWVLQEVSLQGPFLELVLNKDGSLNLPAPVSAADKPQPQPQAESGKADLARLLVREVAISKGRLTFTDRTGGKSAVVTLSPIDLDLKNLSTMAEYCELPDKCGPFSLSAVTSRNEALSWRGTISLVPLASSGHLALKKLQLASLWEFLRDQVRLKKPQGSLDLATDYRVTVGDNGLELGFANLALQGRSLALAPADGGQGEELRLKSLDLAGGKLDLAKLSGSAKSLRLSGLGGGGDPGQAGPHRLGGYRAGRQGRGPRRGAGRESGRQGLALLPGRVPAGRLRTGIHGPGPGGGTLCGHPGRPGPARGKALLATGAALALPAAGGHAKRRNPGGPGAAGIADPGAGGGIPGKRPGPLPAGAVSGRVQQGPPGERRGEQPGQIQPGRGRREPGGRG